LRLLARLHLPQARDSFDWQGEAQTAPWLRKILANTLAEAARKFATGPRDLEQERSLEAAVEESSAQLEHCLTAETPSPSEQALRQEHLVALAEALASCPRTSAPPWSCAICEANRSSIRGVPLRVRKESVEVGARRNWRPFNEEKPCPASSPCQAGSLFVPLKDHQDMPASWLGGEFGGTLLSGLGVTQFPTVCLDLVNAEENSAFLLAFCRREINGFVLLGRVYLTGAGAELFAIGHDGPATIESVDHDNLLGIFLICQIAVNLEKNHPPGALVLRPLLLDGLFLVLVRSGHEPNDPTQANERKQNKRGFLHGEPPGRVNAANRPQVEAGYSVILVSTLRKVNWAWAAHTTRAA
jgi:hypothetical protein